MPSAKIAHVVWLYHITPITSERMTEKFDLVVRNGYIQTENRTVDIGISKNNITDIAEELPAKGVSEIDAEGNLVSSGFVDLHMHMDKAFAAHGDRFPRYGEGHCEPDRFRELGVEYFNTTSKDEIKQNAIKDAKLAVGNGTTHIRTHALIDEDWGVKTTEALVEARDEVSELVDIEIVPYSERGLITTDDVESYIRRSMELGADLVGGMDPLSTDNNVERVIDTWFDIATDYDAGIDCHIHEHGSLGLYTLERLAEKTAEYDYRNNVTASHAYALASESGRRDEVLNQLEQAGVNLVVCHTSILPGMPIKRILQSEITLGHGTDNDQDFVFPHGNADVLEGLLVDSLKLPDDPSKKHIGYRNFDTNEELNLLWQMATEAGASIMNLNNHTVSEGSPADLVVFDASSRQWAITTETARRYVIKDGTVVAENGNITA